ncbi:phosphomannomutase [Rhodovulum visakhapatnamense]|uniref:Phosphomannomutase n=1 Tax=Rhodovulum visakhapatnamense TaxID=364297 RepID=A0A4R8F828_9RHOB|nr:phosphomannomutase [Rhodovulum visakhapatnamense]TDX21586.1 phosphomannomutase [Rhodovulum visakhapatnamense]
MAPKFGTSGLRGLVDDLTPGLVGGYTAAFLASCPTGGRVFVGRDLRASSPRIAGDVIAAVRAAGLEAVDCGIVPTPALAMAAMAGGAGAVMVTGSHIPADRNGLKFYVPGGEISKADEAAISAAFRPDWHAPAAPAGGPTHTAPGTGHAYAARYVRAFGPEALKGLGIGVYQHSSAAREVMAEVVRGLGGDPVPLAWSESFIPVDTEAVDAATREMLAGWCATHGLDAVISTDGDADRPMLTDAGGRVVPGDILGVITARALGARVVCTPVSSNTMVSLVPEFERVALTRIGSPFVIAAMEEVLAAGPGARVVGFEANGGFLLGFEASGPAGALPPLMTRDSLLPMVAVLTAARTQPGGVAGLLETLPARRTAADRLQGVETGRAAALLDRLAADGAARAAFFAPAGTETGCDLTDGLRVSFDSGEIVHLRPSGNAPEFRVYAEADGAGRAEALLGVFLDRVAMALAG